MWGFNSISIKVPQIFHRYEQADPIICLEKQPRKVKTEKVEKKFEEKLMLYVLKLPPPRYLSITKGKTVDFSAGKPSGHCFNQVIKIILPVI